MRDRFCIGEKRGVAAKYRVLTHLQAQEAIHFKVYICQISCYNKMIDSVLLPITQFRRKGVTKMTMLESTISIIKVLPDADLEEIQTFAKRLLKKRNQDCPFALKSREDIYRDLETSRKQIADGEYQDAEEFISEVRKEYGL